MITFKELKNRFTYHKPIPKLNQEERYKEIRATALSYAQYLITVTPESREQSLAITRLEEVMFWAIAAICRNETD